MKKVRIEAHFLISVLLVIISGLNVIVLIFDQNNSASFKSENEAMINDITTDAKAKQLYSELLLCIKKSERNTCVLDAGKRLNRINDEKLINLLKQLIFLEKTQKDKTRSPTLTISTVGFAIACLYCFFILLNFPSKQVE